MSSRLLFSVVFHTVADVVYLILTLRSISVVRQSRWRLHLRWLLPMLVAGTLTLLYRSSVDLHYLAGTRWTAHSYAITYSLLYMGDLVAL